MTGPGTDTDPDVDGATEESGTDGSASNDADGGATDERSLELFEHLDAVRDRLAGAEGLLLCTDFDGTLAPITDDPDAAGITDANEDALRALADREGVELAAEGWIYDDTAVVDSSSIFFIFRRPVDS